MISDVGFVGQAALLTFVKTIRMGMTEHGLRPILSLGAMKSVAPERNARNLASESSEKANSPYGD